MDAIQVRCLLLTVSARSRGDVNSIWAHTAHFSAHDDHEMARFFQRVQLFRLAEKMIFCDIITKMSSGAKVCFAL